METAPLAVTIEDVRSAAERLDGVARVSPLVTSRTLDELAGREVVLKCESFQRTGSFKFRGAYNAISRIEPARRAAGVATYSSGNHAQGVALAARLFGIPAAIVMPSDAPAVKVAAVRGYGAEIIPFDRQTGDGERLQHEVAAERDMTVVHAYDDPHIIAGQGTVALEFLSAVPDLDALVIPAGGGGHLAGCSVAAKALAPRIRLFGVETTDADDTKQSLERGERVTIPPPRTIADGIRLTSPGAVTFPIMQALIEDVLIVGDDDVLEGVRFALQRLKLVVEPTGAVALAAVMRGLVPADCRKVGVVISGGNLDPALLGTLWSNPS